MNPKLKPCKACGHEISRQAPMCPQCGQKHTPEPTPAAGLVGLIAVIVVFWWLFKGPSPEEAAAQQAADASAKVAMQAESNRMIREGTSKFLDVDPETGVITKLEQSGSTWNAWVSHLYILLEPADQAKEAQKIYRAKCTGVPECSVVVYYAETGEEVARYAGAGEVRVALSPEAVATAQEVVDGATKIGIIHKTHSDGPIIEAWVTESFNDLTPRKKLDLGKALQAIHCGTNKSSCFAVFVSAKTGKHLGRYNAYMDELTVEK